MVVVANRDNHLEVPRPYMRNLRRIISHQRAMTYAMGRVEVELVVFDSLTDG